MKDSDWDDILRLEEGKKTAPNFVDGCTLVITHPVLLCHTTLCSLIFFKIPVTEYIQKISMSILKHKPDVVITEKGLSDLCQHYLVKAGVSAIRRIRKTDNNRIAKVCGATICNRVEEITDSDIGTLAGKFEVRKIGDEYFTFVEECQAPKACTILLRGASKDVLNEIERNLQVSDT